MSQITLNDTNYSGYSADITFTAYTGGITSLGTHTIPYTFTSNYYFGTYDLYYSQFNKTCQYNYPPILTITINTSIYQGFYIVMDSYFNSFDLIIDCGAGSSVYYSYQCTLSYAISHNFPDQLLYTITIQVNDPTLINTISSAPPQGTGYGNIISVSELNLFQNLYNVYFDGNSINSQNLNLISTSLTGVTNSGGNLYLNSQTLTACPSGDGIVALNYLQYNLVLYLQYDFTCVGVEVVLDTSLSTQIYFDIQGYSSFNLIIDWGDGSGLDYGYQGNSSYSIFKNLPSGQISKIIFYIDKPNVLFKFYITPSYGNLITYFNNLYLLSNLTQFAIAGQSYLTSIDLSNNNNLTTVGISNTSVDTLLLGSIDNLLYFDISYNKLPVSSINDILISLSNTSITGGFFNSQNQTPPACPTGDGILAQNHLVNDLGWTVVVDTGC